MITFEFDKEFQFQPDDLQRRELPTLTAFDIFGMHTADKDLRITTVDLFGDDFCTHRDIPFAIHLGLTFGLPPRGSAK